MSANLVLQEARRLKDLSTRLDSLAEQLPAVTQPLHIISIHLRETAALLEVLVATKIPPLSGPQ